MKVYFSFSMCPADEDGNPIAANSPFSRKWVDVEAESSPGVLEEINTRISGVVDEYFSHFMHNPKPYEICCSPERNGDSDDVGVVSHFKYGKQPVGSEK